MKGLVLMFAQAWLVGASARRVENMLTRGEASLTARLLTAQVLALAQIVGVGLALGYAGRLFSEAIVLTHLVVLFAVVLISWRRPSLRPPASMATSAMAAFRGWSSGERLAAIALVGVAALVGLTGVLGEHVTHDALSYRLSRIGYWLQEGSLRHFPTNEPRHSYMPINVDLVMLWFTHPFSVGFPFTTLAQAWGAGLLLLSTWSLASAAGLCRRGRLGALALVLGMPSVLVQVTTTQSDLLTAGLASAALALGLASVLQERLMLPGWLGLALAIGAKSTAVFLLPGLALAGLLGVACGRIGWPTIGRHAVCAAGCMALLGSPRHAENLRAWGDPFAPPALYAAHRGEVGLGTLVPKAALNGATYLVQAFDPSSNPAVLAPLLVPTWERLVASLPEADPFSGPVYPRRSSLRFFSSQSFHNADTVATGLLVPALASLGALIAGLRARRRGSPERIALLQAAAAALFFVSFSAMFQWWPTNQRFFSLAAAMLAVLAALAVEALPRRVRRLGWAAAVALSAAIGAEVYVGTVNAAWRALPAPERRELPYWRDHLAEQAVARSLPAGIRLGVALPGNTVLAGLFRQEPEVSISFLPLDAVAEASDAASLLRAARLDALLMRPGLPAGAARLILVPAGGQGPFVLFVRPD